MASLDPEYRTEQENFDSKTNEIRSSPNCDEMDHELLLNHFTLLCSFFWKEGRGLIERGLILKFCLKRGLIGEEA